MPVLFRDLETYSAADLTEVGAHRYAADPTTGVWCVSYAVDNGPTEIWIPGQSGPPIPTPFVEAVHNLDWLLVAHNAAFERAIEEQILYPQFGWPLIPLQQQRCTMAMALAAALPGKLEKVIDALGLPYPKDKAGQALMRKMAKLRPDSRWIKDNPAALNRLYDYCRRDTESERAVYHALPPLTENEQRLWALDAAINARGFHTDGALLDAAHNVVTDTEAALQAEFRELTGLASTNQTAKFVDWLASRGCIVTDVQKGTLRHALCRKELDPEVRRAIELRLELAHASAAKVEALRAWRGDDGRVRGTLQFHGAATGRWVGRGPQPQNFKRDGENIETKITSVMNGGTGLESPVEAVGDIARAMITAAPGHRLLIGDFSGIESRVLAWASRQQSKLDAWAIFDCDPSPDNDPYWIIGRAIGHPKESARAYGKICDLAFGYQGGVGAWQNFAPEGDTSSEEAIKRYRDTWRRQHPATERFWHSLDRAAVRAVASPATDQRADWFVFRFDRPFLRITLPSGRSLSYPFPRLETGKYGSTLVMFLDNAGGKFTDCRFGNGAYGGLWTENIVSAIARDLLAAALTRLEAAGYPVVLHVHDEIVCEVPDGFGRLEEFKELLTAQPDWAEGLPVAAKVREGPRFSKPSTPGESSGAAAALAEPEIADLDDDAPAELLDGSNDGEDAGQAVPDDLEPPGEPQAAAFALDDTAEPVAPCVDMEAAHDRHVRDRGDRHAHVFGGNSNDHAGAVTVKGNGRDRQCDGKARCPFHDDSTPSLQIYNDEGDPHYHCFGCGAHGPLTDLPEELTVSSTPRQKTDDAETLAYAHRLWEQAQPIADTPATRYLIEVRGIDINALAPDIDTVLRFHPACPFNGNRHPCLLALFRDIETNEPSGIHRIALTPDAQKLDRRMLGRWARPRAIKLWPLIRLEESGRLLYLGEGVETVLAAATRLRDRDRPMRPAWAAGSSGNVEKFPIVPGVEELTLLVDRDPSGEAAAAACYRNWKTAGRRVRRLRTHDPSLNDFNDLIRAKLQVAS
jgi:hypothetical protein